MARYTKKPITIDAIQWFKNGDHPEDKSKDKKGKIVKEGKIVRYYRYPNINGTVVCAKCNHTFHNHGWIDTLEGNHIVCPGDYVITGVLGERHSCKPDVFNLIYEKEKVN